MSKCLIMFHFILFVSCDFSTPCYRMLPTDLAEFMSSIYHKKDSPYISIRYKNEANKWKGKPTKYRWENFGEVRQAKLLARKQTQIEQTRAPHGSHQDFDAWVVSWLTVNMEATIAKPWKAICKRGGRSKDISMQTG